MGGPRTLLILPMALREQAQGVAKSGQLSVGSLVGVEGGPRAGQIAPSLEVRRTGVTTVLSFFGAERAVCISRAHVRAI